MGMMDMNTKDNYEISKERAQKYFLKFDQQKLIEKFGLRHDEKCLYIPFLGEEYAIERKSGAVLDSRKEAAGYEETLSIFDLLCHGESLPIRSGHWAPVNSLKGRPAAAGVTLDFAAKYAAAIDADQEGFCTACAGVGGRQVDMGDIGYEIPVFYLKRPISANCFSANTISANHLSSEGVPGKDLCKEDFAENGHMGENSMTGKPHGSYEVSVIVKFYGADEEFPAQITVLWDENTLQYLYYETTFYIVGFLFKKIFEIMQEGKQRQ